MFLCVGVCVCGLLRKTTSNGSIGTRSALTGPFRSYIKNELWNKKSVETIIGNEQSKTAVLELLQKVQDVSVCSGASTMELVNRCCGYVTRIVR
jgi:hypothetical protein